MLDFIKQAIARRREDRGASAVEYGLLIAAIAAVIVAIAFAIGTFVQESFTNTCTDLASTSTAAPGVTETDCDPPT